MSLITKKKGQIQKGNFLMWYLIHKFLSRLIVANSLLARHWAIALVLLVFIGLNNFTTQPALASIRQMEEAPGQVLIQSRHTLRDNQGNSWQVVLFKRTKPDSSSIIHLRLVDFPGLADFAHPQPLTISTDTGDLFKAEDVFAQKSPAANVGEFDVQKVLSRLPITKLNLSLEMKGDDSTNLSIPPEVVLEWQSIAARS